MYLINKGFLRHPSFNYTTILLFLLLYINHKYMYHEATSAFKKRILIFIM
jgi:hypothetical protein